MFYSVQEIMESLLAGRKIRITDWFSNNFIHLKDGNLVANDGEEITSLHLNLHKESWEEYIGPAKKMHLYKITSIPYGDSFVVSAFSKKEARIFLHNYLCKTWKDKDDTIDILSVKHSICERLKLDSNLVISSTTDCVKPNI